MRALWLLLVVFGCAPPIGVRYAELRARELAWAEAELNAPAPVVQDVPLDAAARAYAARCRRAMLAQPVVALPPYVTSLDAAVTAACRWNAATYAAARRDATLAATLCTYCRLQGDRAPWDCHLAAALGCHGAGSAVRALRSVITIGSGSRAWTN